MNRFLNKANALVCYYVAETLLCDPVLRHGWDGMSKCRKTSDSYIFVFLSHIVVYNWSQIATGSFDAPNRVQRYKKILTYANLFAKNMQNGGKNATVMRFYSQFCVNL